MTDPEPAREGAELPAPLECQLLGCIILDEAVLDLCKGKITAADFSGPRERLVFETMLRMRESGLTIALDTLFGELGHRGHEVGLDNLMKWSDLTEIQNPAECGVACIQRMGKGRTIPQRTPFSFKIPSATDESVLLGNRYLNRGDGMILSGPSGMGKSSIQMQMTAQWALGRPFHGIKSSRPLRSLIVQSEDSDGDIAEVWASLAHVEGWTEEVKARIDGNVRIVTDRVNRGVRFLTALKAHVEQFQPDLVWLNPLQAFIDGDVTDSKDLGQFLREGLNGLNNGAFGYVIIHHTTKPATGKDRHERLWHEVMYDMAGGAELINWARGIISLRPLEQKGDFKLVLAKRGRRAGVTKTVEHGVGTRPEPVTEIGLRHSTERLPSGVPVIHWGAMELPTEEGKTKGAGGRPEKHRFEDYSNIFPAHDSPGLPFSQMANLLRVNGEIRKDVLHNTLKRWSDQGNIEILKPHGAPMLFRKSV